MKKKHGFATVCFVCSLLVLTGCSGGGLHSPSAPSASDFGLLVMAHGGSEEWNRGVLNAVQALGAPFPVQVAFGMADPNSLQEGVEKLENVGVERVAVVRLFISGESFLDRTRKILGVDEGGSIKPEMAGHAGHASGMAHGMGAAWRIETAASFALSQEGLAEAPEMGAVLLDRAKQLSHHADTEDVLILAHGPGDDQENQRWVQNINARAEPLKALGFRRVEVLTLREDWHEKRALAEQRIRAYVARAEREGGRALVIPFRVQGFGPYASVLDGLNYVSDGVGLIPHEAVSQWLARQAASLRQGAFEVALP